MYNWHMIVCFLFVVFLTSEVNSNKIPSQHTQHHMTSTSYWPSKETYQILWNLSHALNETAAVWSPISTRTQRCQRCYLFSGPLTARFPRGAQLSTVKMILNSMTRDWNQVAHLGSAQACVISKHRSFVSAVDLLHTFMIPVTLF